MIANIKLIFAAAALALLAACSSDSNISEVATAKTADAGSAAGSVQMSVDAYRPERTESTPSQVNALQARSAATAPTAMSINLGTPLASMTASASTGSAEMGKPFQVSFGRDVAQANNANLTSQLLNWQSTLTGGQAAAISVTSANAKALRMGLLVTKLSETATLRFYKQGSPTAYVVSGTEVNQILEQNAASGDKTDAARTFWSPQIDGTEMTFEISLPAGVSTADVTIAIPQVSHFFVGKDEMGSMTSSASPMASYSWANAALSCQVDVKCAALPSVSDSVAMLVFQKGGSGYQCSGTLLNNTANDGLPYVLTANHCIENQTEASSLTTWWLYRSASCNATSGTYQQVSGGASLKYTAYNTDSTLLLLNSAAPAGTLYAGWDANPQALNTSLTGIHHPQSDAQRKSTGSIAQYYTRSATNPNSFLNSNITNSTILGVNLTNGIVEPGSSGSGIFKDINTANPKLVGQLFGGTAASCTAGGTSSPQSTGYGRFDYAFAAGMSDWLSPGRKAVYRFYNTNLGTHFFTMNGVERNNIIATLPQYRYEGVSFYAYSSQSSAAGLSPVYRFFNTQTGAHFYTINVGEKNTVQATLPQYSYEGVKWYAQTSAGNGSSPLYRFFHTGNGTHFYTVSSVERDNVRNTLPIYSYENTAYHVWLTP